MNEDVQSFYGPLSERVRAQAIACCRGLHGRLLDVGCGNGLFFEALAQEADLGCFGVDRSLELLTEALRRLDGRLGCAGGMIHALPFQDRAFDVVTCLNTLLNLPSLDATAGALREMMRVSAGRVIVDIRNAGNPYIRAKYRRHRRRATFSTFAYHVDAIARIFRSGGFAPERAYPIGLNHRWLAWGYVVTAIRT